MNFRYDIQHIDGKKLAEYYVVNVSKPNETFTLSLNQSRHILRTKTRHEENALYYQLLKLIYLKKHSDKDWHDDRELYKKGDRKTINKFYDILLDKLVYIDFESVFTTTNAVKRKEYESVVSEIFDSGFVITYENRELVKYLPFQKSGSMSRSHTISFINEKYKEELDLRLDFGLFLENEKYNISKVLAYKGLYLSSGIRVDLETLDENSVVVVNDYKKKDNTSFYTTVINRATIKTLILEMFFKGDEDVFTKNLSTLKDYCIGVESDKAKEYYDTINLKKLNPFEFMAFNAHLLNGIKNDFYESAKYIFYACGDYQNDDFLSAYKLLGKNNSLIHSAIEDIINDHLNILGLEALNHDDEYKIVENINTKVNTNMFDGQGFIDKTFMEGINKTHLHCIADKYHYSAQFRLPYCKGMIHALDFSEWFSYAKTPYIMDAFNIKRDVSKIKMILTVSQFKCYKWIKNLYRKDIIDKDKYEDPMQFYFSNFKRYDHALYFTNLDNPLESSDRTVLNYQVLHTPELTNSDFFKILKVGNNYYKNLLTKEDAQVNYFTENLQYEDTIGDINLEKLKKEHILLGEILKKNPDFINDSLFQNRLSKVAQSILKNIKLGRVQIEGSVNYLSGDLLENLHYITFGGGISLTSHDIKDFFYLPKYHNQLDKKKMYSILRNPHITSKELIVSKPIKEENNVIRERFFGHLNNVIMINAYTNGMMAMQTADTDGDMVRLIANDIYNEGVQKAIKKNEGSIILYPEIAAENRTLSPKNIYKTIKQTFSARVGIISDHAFSYSITAYNANLTDPIEKYKARLEAEKLSCIVAAEIDAAKSGKAPYYIPENIKEPYVKYKRQVKMGKEETTTFKLNSDSPNLHYLKQVTKDLRKDVRKRRITSDLKKFTRFHFEEEKGWRKSLNKELKRELSLLILAYNEWNQHLGNLWRGSQKQTSTIMSTISYILDLQYDDGVNEMLVETILDKFTSMNKNSLAQVRNNLIKDGWHYALESEKDQICENLLPNKLKQNEKDLLYNFSFDGHKLFFLILTEAISRIEKSMLGELNVHNSIERYKIMLKYELDYHLLNSDVIIDNIINDILSLELNTSSLMSKYINSTTLFNTYEYTKVEKYINELYLDILSYKKKDKKITLEDLNTVGNHFTAMCSNLFDDGKNLVESVIPRSFAYTYCHDELGRMFIEHDESIDEIIKYVYSLKRKYDSSSRFLLTICYDKLLENVKDNRKQGEESAE